MMTNKQTIAQTYLIIGLGQTGLSCARLLIEKGHIVAVMDTRDQPPALATLQNELPEVLVHTGGLSLDWMLKSDVIVLSPGVDPRLPEIKAAKQHGVDMVGDIELFARYVKKPIIAITGSNGKSTVTTMVAEMATMSGKAIQVGGNLGTPALELITTPEPDFYILELSSFQLETVSTLNAHAAVVLNISPDHLDRYDDEQQYQQAKAKVYAGTGTMVVNKDDHVVNSWVESDRPHIHFTMQQPAENEFGLIDNDGKTYLAYGEQTLLDIEQLRVTGSHNVANALAALAVGQAMDLSMTAMLTALVAYQGLPHRCQLVATQNNIRWVNDSKATNVGACIAAIEGLAETKNIILIAGGVAKDQDFASLTKVLSQYVKTTILMGQDAHQLAEIMPSDVTAVVVQSMNDAVKQANDYAQSGDIVLLSPACASFDMFKHYIDRGEQFMSAVKAVI